MGIYPQIPFKDSRGSDKDILKREQLARAVKLSLKYHPGASFGGVTNGGCFGAQAGSASWSDWT